MFRLLLSEPFQAELYFLQKAMYAIVSTIIDCDISHYVFKILQN